MITGVTPQKTVDEGYTEAQFARIFMVTAPLLASGVPVELPESRANRNNFV